MLKLWSSLVIVCIAGNIRFFVYNARIVMFATACRECPWRFCLRTKQDPLEAKEALPAQQARLLVHLQLR